MYDELISALRNNADHYGYEGENGLVHLLTNAADAIEELNREKESLEKDVEIAAYVMARRWVPVTERLPDEEESVFVVRKFFGIKGQVPPSTYTEIAYRCGDRWVADSDEYKIARHRHTDPLYWMPLPEPPKWEAE